MIRTNLQVFKALYQVDRLANSRQVGKDVKLLTKIIRYIFAAFTFILMLFLAVVLVKSSSDADFDLNLIGSVGLIGLGGFFIYDLILRLSMPINLYDELLPYFILPLPKRAVIFYKTIKSLPDIFILLWFTLLISLYGALNYIQSGGVGIVYSCVLLLLILSINKQLFIFFKTRFSKYKLISLLTITATYLLFLGLGFAQLYAYKNYGFTLGVDLFVPIHLGYFLILGTVLLALFSFLFYINLIHFSKFRLDEIGEEDSGEHSKTKLLSKSTLFERYGSLGKQVQNDLLFMLRTKRLRNILIIVPLALLLIGLGYIGKEQLVSAYQANYFWFFYLTLLSYLNYIPYESAYFEFYATKQGSFSNLLRSKYIITSLLALVLHLLALLIAIPNGISILSIFGLFTFSIGIIPLLSLQIYVYNQIAVDVSSKKKANMSFNGVIFVALLAAAIIPSIAIAAGYYFIESELLLTVILAIPNLIIAFSLPFWLKNIERRMAKRKYINLTGIKNSLG